MTLWSIPRPSRHGIVPLPATITSYDGYEIDNLRSCESARRIQKLSDAVLIGGREQETKTLLS